MTTNYDEYGATWDDLALVLEANFIDYEAYPVTGSMLVEVRNKLGKVPLPRGKQGLQGPPGKAAKPFERVVKVASAGSLPGDPDADDKATAWVAEDTGLMWAWNGSAFAAVGLFRGETGPMGPAVTILPGNVTATDPGTAPTHAFEKVSDGVYLYHVTLPRGARGPQGERGPEGPAAAISQASDYNQESGTPAVGSVLRMGALGKWEPTPNYREAGPYVPDASAWTEYNEIVGTTAPQRTVVSVNVPPQPFPWRPRAFASCHVAGPSDGTMSLEARLGSDSGQVIARGIAYGGGDKHVTAVPDFGGPVTESSVVAANTGVTVFLVMRRASGILPWKQRKGFGALQVWCVPVVN
ncbi:minor tail protein [Gordonia phage Gsput1]|uniref:Minor tail protein n=1 Tax=Gordonia phage Gsput1 TaxID=1622193 RepID=A0A0E3T6Z1_9CAUD|nr:minor tail protein [Gordonia phage Gsput1]AKC03049.1 hypothetical protein Gsput1_24 [Gordonia phage Gsput1]